MNSVDTFDALLPVTEQAIFSVFEGEWYECDGMMIVDMMDSAGQDVTVSYYLDDPNTIILLGPKKYGDLGSDFLVHSIYDLRCLLQQQDLHAVVVV